MKVPVRHQIRKDETVFSWLARLYRTGTFFNERNALEVLLGRFKVRIHPYLPSHLSDLSESTQLPAEALLLEHSLYLLFWWFGLDPKCRLKEAMLANRGDRAIMLAGLPHAKLHFFEGLKYCSCCVQKNRRELGFGYFKVSHQIPGIEACAEHGCLLKGIASGDYGYDRHLLLPPVSEKKEERATKELLDFAVFLVAVFKYSMSVTQPLDYKEVYQVALADRGLLTPYKRIRLKKIVEDMTCYLELFPFGNRLGIPNELKSLAFVGPLLRNKTHYPCHPIKHLLFAYWLFQGCAEKFINACDVSQKKCKANEILASNTLVGPRGTDSVLAEKIQQAVSVLKKLTEEHPLWRRKEIKVVCSSAYFLLYHQERMLLESLLPAKQPIVTPAKNWDLEDSKLIEAITKIRSVGEMSLSEIDYRANARGFLCRNLSNLPRCQVLLKRLGKVKGKN